MSFSARELKEQAAAVRSYWRGRPNVTLSAEGSALLSMVEGLPREAWVIDRATFERWLKQGLDCQDEIAVMLRAGVPPVRTAPPRS